MQQQFPFFFVVVQVGSTPGTVVFLKVIFTVGYKVPGTRYWYQYLVLYCVWYVVLVPVPPYSTLVPGTWYRYRYSTGTDLPGFYQQVYTGTVIYNI